MDDERPTPPPLKGRGTAHNPTNRFETLSLAPDPEWLEWERREGLAPGRVATRYYADATRDVLSENHSPDVPFRYSVNPYRGCEHGCVYCYARPTHEYLGFSAGLDFESRILVKTEAPALLAARLNAPRWEPQAVALSGVTDPYQPVERRLRLTRGCLEVFLDFGNPLELISKNDLVLRDLDLLGRLAGRRLVRVTLSVTTLDPELAARMEPRAAPPARRLEAIARLAEAGVPTGVNLAPVIPGLNDHELPAILAAAAERGAGWANYILLRLPFAVKELFVDWLGEHYPQRQARVVHALQEMRGGALSDPRFGTRLRGEGVRAAAVERLFEVTCRKLGLSRRGSRDAQRLFDLTGFRRKPAHGAQGELFAGAAGDTP